MIILRRLCRGLKKARLSRCLLVIVRTLKALVLMVCRIGRPRVRPMRLAARLGLLPVQMVIVFWLLLTVERRALLVSVKLVARIILILG